MESIYECCTISESKISSHLQYRRLYLGFLNKGDAHDSSTSYILGDVWDITSSFCHWHLISSFESPQALLILIAMVPHQTDHESSPFTTNWPLSLIYFFFYSDVLHEQLCYLIFWGLYTFISWVLFSPPHLKNDNLQFRPWSWLIITYYLPVTQPETAIQSSPHHVFKIKAHKNSLAHVFTW